MFNFKYDDYQYDNCKNETPRFQTLATAGKSSFLTDILKLVNSFSHVLPNVALCYHDANPQKLKVSGSLNSELFLFLEYSHHYHHHPHQKTDENDFSSHHKLNTVC